MRGIINIIVGLFLLYLGGPWNRNLSGARTPLVLLLL